LKFRNNLAENWFEAQASTGTHPGRDHSQPIGGETSSATFSPSVRPTPLITVRRLPCVEYLDIHSRGRTTAEDKPIRHVTETQARSLLALGLVEPVCKSRRGIVVALRIGRGVSVAAIAAALRAGAGNQLPIAEDNRTVRRVGVPGFGVYHEPLHVSEWDDGRPLDGRCLARGGTRLTRHGNGER